MGSYNLNCHYLNSPGCHEACFESSCTQESLLAELAHSASCESIPDLPSQLRLPRSYFPATDYEASGIHNLHNDLGGVDFKLGLGNAEQANGLEHFTC